MTTMLTVFAVGGLLAAFPLGIWLLNLSESTNKVTRIRLLCAFACCCLELGALMIGFRIAYPPSMGLLAAGGGIFAYTLLIAPFGIGALMCGVSLVMSWRCK